MFNFNDKVVIVTGGAQGIGKCIVEVFKKEGAKVAIIDIKENEYFIGDIGDKNTLERFANKVITDYGKVDFLINNAAPKMCGISNGTYEDFEYSLRVGVTAPFYLAKLLAPYFNDGASIVNISSSRDRMSQPETESYTAAKGGISALTHALSVSFAGKVRVNAISPGWIENSGIVYAFGIFCSYICYKPNIAKHDSYDTCILQEQWCYKRVPQRCVAARSV